MADLTVTFGENGDPTYNPANGVVPRGGTVSFTNNVPKGPGYTMQWTDDTNPFGKDVKVKGAPGTSKVYTITGGQNTYQFMSQYSLESYTVGCGSGEIIVT